MVSCSPPSDCGEDEPQVAEPPSVSDGPLTPVQRPDGGSSEPAVLVVPKDAGAEPDYPYDGGAGPEFLPPPSCQPSLSCSGRSCCETRFIPGGTFAMGRSVQAAGSDAWAGGEASEIPEHEATVSSFYLDAFEVTVGRFRRFASEYPTWLQEAGLVPGDGAIPSVEGSGWSAHFVNQLPETATEFGTCPRTWTDAEGANETVPVNCVNWYLSYAFCIWDGGRLPSELEWEFAAAGGTEERRFAWGPEVPDPERRPTAVVPVGMQPYETSRFGVEDLSGNLWEWTRDMFNPNWYDTGGRDCVDCANVAPGTHRTVRGGSFRSHVESFRAANRFRRLPELPYEDSGIRCVRDIVESN